MPRRDGTGPMGLGPIGGRGFGHEILSETDNERNGSRKSRRIYRRPRMERGYGRCFGLFNSDDGNCLTEKELLIKQKKFMESKLDIINNQLEKLKEAIK
ncbi:MAG: DUF5320 domain-containing protein [Proteocatella sp.]